MGPGFFFSGSTDRDAVIDDPNRESSAFPDHVVIRRRARLRLYRKAIVQLPSDTVIQVGKRSAAQHAGHHERPIERPSAALATAAGASVLGIRKCERHRTSPASVPAAEGTFLRPQRIWQSQWRRHGVSAADAPLRDRLAKRKRVAVQPPVTFFSSTRHAWPRRCSIRQSDRRRSGSPEPSIPAASAAPRRSSAAGRRSSNRCQPDRRPPRCCDAQPRE